jgi:membrane protein
MHVEYNMDEKELFIRMNNLRGYFAIVVLLSHIWGYTGMSILVPFNKMVTIAVAMFFFLSGYGMIRSYSRKENYIKEIFTVKIPYLCFMAVTAYLFSAVMEIIVKLSSVEKYNFLPLGVGRFIYSTNWYVYELLGFYVLFALVMKFIKKRYQLIVILGVSIAAFVILYKADVVEAYYNSIIGFWFGMLCGKYQATEIVDQHKKGWLLGSLILVGAFGGMFILDRESMIFAVIRNFAAVGAMVLVLYMIRYIDVNDKFSRYLSKISPEIYFYHMPIALLLSQTIKDQMVFSAVVVVLTFLIAPLINIVDQQVHTKIKYISGV